MRTRRIIRKKRTNRTVSKRNKKSAKKKAYRRKTVKGGVRLEPLSIEPSIGVNQYTQNANNTKQFDPKRMKHRKRINDRDNKQLETIPENTIYKDLFTDNKSLYMVFYKDLFTDNITEIPVTEVLKIVFEKYPMQRFSSYFGKDTGTRQQTNIQSLTDLLNNELCSLDTDPETSNCTTGFTADQWANSQYCKENYKAKSGLRYWDTGNKLCEYIPYAMKQLEKDYYTENKSVGILLFKKKDTGFYFDWAYQYTDLLTEKIVKIPVPNVLQLVFKTNPIKRFSGYFGTDVQARQLQNIAAEKISSDLCKADEGYPVTCTTGFTADEWANSQYCLLNKGNKLCEYIPYAMKFLQRKMKDLEQAKRDVGEDVSPQTIRFGKRNGSFRFYWITPAEIIKQLKGIKTELNVLIKDCEKVQEDLKGLFKTHCESDYDTINENELSYDKCNMLDILCTNESSICNKADYTYNNGFSAFEMNSAYNFISDKVGDVGNIITKINNKIYELEREQMNPEISTFIDEIKSEITEFQNQYKAIQNTLSSNK